MRISKSRSAICLLLLLATPFTSASEENPATRAEEARGILANLVATHPRGKEIAALPEFNRLADKLDKTADSAILSQYVETLRKVFSLANDGHTALLSFQLSEGPYGVRLPVLVEVFERGVYVIEAKDEALPLLGARITKVANTPIEEVMRRYVESANGDNIAFKVRWSLFLFSSPALLQGMDFIGEQFEDQIEIEAINRNGERITVKVDPRGEGNVDRIPIERKMTQIEAIAVNQPSYGNTHFPLFTHRLNNGRALYVSLAEMGDQDGMPFQSLVNEVENALSASKLDRIIIDLRQNGGGNNLLAEPLRRALVRSRFNKPGGIYILTSRKTFSAAMNFATRMERETDAIFVGEPTGGKPNHLGDANYTVSPLTGLAYLVSTVAWQDSAPFDNRIWILPDIPVWPTFNDFVAGRDKALEAALNDEPNAAEFDAARISTPWERPSQLRGWKYFFETD